MHECDGTRRRTPFDRCLCRRYGTGWPAGAGCDGDLLRRFACLFVAQGVLTSTANRQGETAQAGVNNLYVFEHDSSHSHGQVTFITQLPGTDSEQWDENEQR